MLTGIDHVIVAVRDPDAAAALLYDRLGLQAAGGGRHEAHGTHNRLVWMGDSYLELIGVFDAELAERSWWGHHMSAVLGGAAPEQGGGYAGVVFATDDVAAEAKRLRAIGAALGEPSAGERQRPDGDVVRWRSARPPAPDPDLGLMFLIEHDTSSAEWRDEDRAARAALEMPGLGRVRLARVEFGVPDVARASMRLLREFGIHFRPSLAGGGARDASIGNQTLRLMPSRTATAPMIALRVEGQPRTAELLGVRWELVAG